MNPSSLEISLHGTSPKYKPKLSYVHLKKFFKQTTKKIPKRDEYVVFIPTAYYTGLSVFLIDNLIIIFEDVPVNLMERISDIPIRNQINELKEYKHYISKKGNNEMYHVFENGIRETYYKDGFITIEKYSANEDTNSFFGNNELELKVAKLYPDGGEYIFANNYKYGTRVFGLVDELKRKKVLFFLFLAILIWSGGIYLFKYLEEHPNFIENINQYLNYSIYGIILFCFLTYLIKKIGPATFNKNLIHFHENIIKGKLWTLLIGPFCSSKLTSLIIKSTALYIGWEYIGKELGASRFLLISGLTAILSSLLETLCLLQSRQIIFPNKGVFPIFVALGYVYLQLTNQQDTPFRITPYMEYIAPGFLLGALLLDKYIFKTLLYPISYQVAIGYLIGFIICEILKKSNPKMEITLNKLQNIKYEGHFRNLLPNGEGKLIFSEKEISTTFRNGKPTRTSVITFKDGKYEGQINSKFEKHGRGKEFKKFENYEEIYEGEFKNGKRDGKGKLQKIKNGKVFEESEGYFKNDEFYGK